MPASGGAAGATGIATRPIRVALADDSRLVREALEHVLDAREEIEVVAACGDRDALLRAVDEQRPDVVVTDIRMPPTHTDEGLQVAALLRERRPRIGVVVLSQFAEARYGLALFDDGSNGRAYLLKERVLHRDQLVAAIEAVARGGTVVDAKVVEGLIAQRAEHAAPPELTPREVEILACVARGHSDQAIAGELGLTARAVEEHVDAIVLRLGLTDAVAGKRRVKAALDYLSESVA